MIQMSRSNLLPKGTATQVRNEILSVFKNFYLSKIEIINSNVPLSGVRKSLTSIRKIFLPNSRITKSKNNPKIQLIEEISLRLEAIANSPQLDENGKLQKIISLMRGLNQNDKGNFGKAVRYINEYLNNIINPSPSFLIMKDSKEFKTIEQTFMEHAKASKKKSMRFEPSRVFKKGSNTTTNLLREMTLSPPEFGGEEEFVVIQKIQKLENPGLSARYQKAKEEIKSVSNPEEKKMNIGLDIDGLTDGLDVAAGEVYLYHGTSFAASRLIAHEGFNAERFCTLGVGGYGPLGRGTYFTDELPKAGTFTMCALCGNHRCLCKTAEGVLIPKVTFICKVALGNPQVIIEKSKAISESITPPSGFHSRIGLSKKDHIESKFNSNEIAISNDAQIYPEYAVFYHHYKNMLKPSVWKKEILKNKIDINHHNISLLSNLILQLAINQNQLPDQKNTETQLELLLHIKKLASESVTIFSDKERIFEILKLQCDYYINKLTEKLNIVEVKSPAIPKPLAPDESGPKPDAKTPDTKTEIPANISDSKLDPNSNEKETENHDLKRLV